MPTEYRALAQEIIAPPVRNYTDRTVTWIGMTISFEEQLRAREEGVNPFHEHLQRRLAEASVDSASSLA